MNLRDVAIQFIKGELPITKEELARERIKVCEECPDFASVSRQCKTCWCFMDMKTRLANAECPQGRW